MPNEPALNTPAPNSGTTLWVFCSNIAVNPTEIVCMWVSEPITKQANGREPDPIQTQRHIILELKSGTKFNIPLTGLNPDMKKWLIDNGMSRLENKV